MLKEHGSSHHHGHHHGRLAVSERPPHGGAVALVILIGSIRGGELTWRALERNVLRPNGAHLAILADRGARNTTLLHRLADYVWEWDAGAGAGWAAAVDAVAAGLELPEPGAWRHGVVESNATCCYTVEACCMRPKFLGPISWSASINLVMRYEVKRRLQQHGLVRRYGTFVVTRADQYFGCPLALAPLDAGSVWIPEGEDYYGITDRLVVCSRADVLKCLSIIDGYLAAPSRYRHEGLGPEGFYRQRLKELQLWPRVRRFPRVMFTAAAPGDATRWSAPSERPDPIYRVHLKYESEYVRVKWACGLCERGVRGAERFCCGHLGLWPAKALADAFDMRTQLWDHGGVCRTMAWARLVYAAAVLAAGALALEVARRRRHRWRGWAPAGW